ncbi:MAG: SPOR domain-containing protein [Candidatus Omnitrophota bacterium]
MRKLNFYFVISAIFVLPVTGWAANLDDLKSDFLAGNYRRVIFEAQAQAERFNIQGADELVYILGLSYLKEDKPFQAQECFRRVLSNPLSKFKDQASMASADVYLIKGQFQEAEGIYNKLLEDNPNINLKAAILYRLSQSNYRKGNNEQSDEYLMKLKRDYPLSLELRPSKGIPVNLPFVNESGGFSVQVGFFVKNLNAVNFKDKLLDMRYPAYVEASSEGYRVKVGRFKTQTEAQDSQNRLSREGFPTKLCP